VRLDELTVRQLLDSIAAKTPTPGGGAVAAITAALSAAIAQMVVNYSLGKKSLAEHHTANRHALDALQRIAQHALELAHDDARAYAAMNDLWKLPDDDPRRQREMPAAVEAAIAPPHQMLDASLQILDLIQNLRGKTNASLRSDLAIAALLADAAARAAAWNITINLPLLHDAAQREALAGKVHADLSRSATLAAEIDAACRRAG
jgi:formiminotetrahydrofolate cyclodeaminase